MCDSLAVLFVCSYRVVIGARSCHFNCFLSCRERERRVSSTSIDISRKPSGKLSGSSRLRCKHRAPSRFALLPHRHRKRDRRRRRHRSYVTGRRSQVQFGCNLRSGAPTRRTSQKQRNMRNGAITRRGEARRERRSGRRRRRRRPSGDAEEAEERKQRRMERVEEARGARA